MGFQVWLCVVRLEHHHHHICVFCVPETKDWTLEEIYETFEEKLPARKFKGYQVRPINIARNTGLPIADEEKAEAVHEKDFKLEEN